MASLRDNHFLLAAGVLAVTVPAALLIAGWLRFGPVDDAFISLRYATNWANGTGLVFNPHEKVEGFSSFLTVALEAGLIGAWIDPAAAMKLVSWTGFGLLTVGLSWFFRYQILPGHVGGALVLAVITSMNLGIIGWTASGMETSLYSFLVLLTLLTSLHATDTPVKVAVPAVALCLAAMTRPEAMILFPATMLVIFQKTHSVTAVRRFAAAFVLLFGLYFSIRWAHFGQIFPNTFYAKLDYGSTILLQRGLRYVWDFVLAQPLLALSVPISLAFWKSSPTWVKATLVFLAVLTLTVVYEGGDHFAMHRFLVPTLPLLSGLVVFASQKIEGLFPSRLTRLSPPVLAAVVILGLSSFGNGARLKPDEEVQVTHRARLGFEALLAKEWTRVGQWFSHATPENATLATVAIGAIGQFSERFVLDPHGLIDPAIAHQKQKLGTGYPGHEKFDLDRIFARSPHYLLLMNRITSRPILPEELPSTVWGEFNRAILRDSRLEERYRYEVVDLGPEGYLNLHVRRDLRQIGRTPLLVRQPSAKPE